MAISEKFTIKSDLAEVKILAKHFRVFCSENKINDQFAGLLELALVELD